MIGKGSSCGCFPCTVAGRGSIEKRIEKHLTIESASLHFVLMLNDNEVEAQLPMMNGFGIQYKGYRQQRF